MGTIPRGPGPRGRELGCSPHTYTTAAVCVRKLRPKTTQVNSKHVLIEVQQEYDKQQ
jgi:hypothetical protein